MSSPETSAPARRPLAQLVPVGTDASKPPQPVLQPIMVLRSQGLPFAVLLVSPHRAYIKAIAASDLKINDLPTSEHQLTSGDRIGLGPVVYEFKAEIVPIANGHASPMAFLASEDARFALRQPIAMLGANPHSDVRLGDPDSSTADLAVVVELQEGHALVALDSPPAFQINGVNKMRHKLAEGDVITVGEYSLRYITDFKLAPAPSHEPQADDTTDSSQNPPAEVKADSKLEEVTAPAEAPPVKRPLKKPEPPRVPAANLSAWGPLAHAVIAGQSIPDMNAQFQPAAPEVPPSHAMRWVIILLVLIALAGGAVFAWLKFGARLLH